MADHKTDDIEQKPRLFSFIGNLIDKLKATQEKPVLYYIKNARIEPVEIENGSPFHSPIINLIQQRQTVLNDINEELTKKNLQHLHLKEKDFFKALAYLLPEKEVKPGQSVTAKDGEKISYEEFAEISGKIQNLSMNDAYMDKMPRIFIFPELPAENTPEGYVLKKIGKVGNMAAMSENNSILINKNFLQDNTKEEIKAAYAHEYGHLTDNATKGKIFAEHNLIAHGHALLGDKFLDDCGIYLLGGPLNEECDNNIVKIREDIPNIAPPILKKNAELSKAREFSADRYPALIGYGDSLIKLLKKLYEWPSEYNVHPSTDERISYIKSIQRDPEAALQKLEREIAGTLKGFSPAPANYNNIKPASMPAPNAAPKTDKNRRLNVY